MKKLSFLFILLFSIKLHAYKIDDLAKYKSGNTDLQNLDLSDALIYQANFANKNLTNTNLSRAILFYADFSGANLTKAKLTFTLTGYSNFCGANLKDAEIKNIICPFSNFINVTGLSAKQLEYLKECDAIFDQQQWNKVVKIMPDHLKKIEQEANNINDSIEYLNSKQNTDSQTNNKSSCWSFIKKIFCCKCGKIKD